MCFNAIRENKILGNITKITVIDFQEDSHKILVTFSPEMMKI